VGPRVGLDAVEMRTILHCRESNPGYDIIITLKRVTWRAIQKARGGVKFVENFSTKIVNGGVFLGDSGNS
jgi:hypothetical protein